MKRMISFVKISRSSAQCLIHNEPTDIGISCSTSSFDRPTDRPWPSSNSMASIFTFIINNSSDASTRSKELLTSRALSHAGRITHWRRRNRHVFYHVQGRHDDNSTRSIERKSPRHDFVVRLMIVLPVCLTDFQTPTVIPHSFMIKSRSNTLKSVKVARHYAARQLNLQYSILPHPSCCRPVQY